MTVNEANSPRCDGQGLKRMAEAGLAWLEHNHQHVNDLNVFPVPDGDTGTNMLLTMRSAYREIAESTEKNAGKVARKIYNGALMGARGNSGVILSQLWRGISNGLTDKPDFTAADIMNCLEEATRIAYGAVQEPVEGTVLTVIREVSESVQANLDQSIDFSELMTHVVSSAKDSVNRTPELLPVLKEAGVVDSGGMGLAYVLEGMLMRLHGEELSLMAQSGDASPSLSGAQGNVSAEEELDYGYDVQFLLKGESLNVATVRRDIEAMGDSGLIVGDDSLIKVHIHVHDPGVPISYGAQRGVLLDVVVENMQEQYEELVAQQSDIVEPIAPPEIEPGSIAVIAVAPSIPLANIFYNLGASFVISGGQTMNPSTGDILAGIEKLDTDKIVILPNNKNILMAAQKAAEALRDQGSEKDVRVVPSRTIPQGTSALFALGGDDLDAVAEEMVDALGFVESGEVTLAVRNANIDGVAVSEGQIIGLHNGTLTTAGDSINEVVFDLLDRMDAADGEIITFYRGGDASEAAALNLISEVAETYPDQEVELALGGQPHYHYIIGVE